MKRRGSNNPAVMSSTTTLDTRAGLTIDIAEHAAKGAKQVDDTFEFVVHIALTVIDVLFPANHQPFAPQLADIQKTYRFYVWATYALSLAIADYGEKFDGRVVKLCADKSLPVQYRLSQISQFIREADGIHSLADDITTRLDELADKLATFIGVFQGWLTQAWQAQAQAIQNALKEVQEDIAKVRAAVGWARGVGFAATTECPEALLSARRLSQKDGNDPVNDAVVAIEALGQLWQSVSNDTLAIELWLKEGAIDANMPEYMRTALDEAASRYKDMDIPLRAYATCLTEANIPHPE
ncbi:hypothetical protein C8Q74DRAFT_1268034 [Fomes fomentarius]|nr:hypothetical protein C8Q74DRAFT_1268034 [Fomes fomentarius]